MRQSSSDDVLGQAEPFALLVAQLAYEQSETPALAYRFEVRE